MAPPALFTKELVAWRASMTRTPHNQLAKVLLPAWLSPLGQALAGQAIASEVRESDVSFVPERAPTRSEAAALRFLATLCQVPRLFEVDRNAVTAVQLEESVAKTLELRNAHRRALRRKSPSRPKKGPAPELCLLTLTCGRRSARWRPSARPLRCAPVRCRRSLPTGRSLSTGVPP